MTYKERKKISTEICVFPEALNEAIKKKFGKNTNPYTYYCIDTGTHRTGIDAHKMKKRYTLSDFNTFVEGFMAGNSELADRINLHLMDK